MTLYTPEIAANRFGFGAAPGELARYAIDPVAELKRALEPPRYVYHPWTSSAALTHLALHNEQKKRDKKKPVAMSLQQSDKQQALPGKRVDRKHIIQQSRSLALDTFNHAINSQQGLQARLVDFFSNHFSVSANGLKMAALAPTLEREAIAPHISGYFSDMLLAVESHPAMLIYLNNEQSAGNDSKAAKRRKPLGLNENLAREILELHSLGVHGGYTQADVIELAMAISGWSVTLESKNLSPPGFLFKPQLHQPGDRQLLGKTYKRAGVEQGIAILKDLSVHPATAAFVSHKLARHFIADEPPEALVNAMSQTWLKSDGHLGAVLTTMIEHPLSWKPESTKFKSPREFVISACRACGVSKSSRPGPFDALTFLGQKPFDAGSPAGFGDVSSAWNGAEALLSRIEWAEHLAANVKADPMKLAKMALGSQLSAHTAQFVRRAESRQQGLALLLMSPEFQRR